MRIRGTKPEFWRSERIASVSWDARLVLKGLESYVDDNGVGKDDLALIVGDLFQRDLVREHSRTLARVSEAISDLCQAGLVWRYEADGTQLLYLSFWEQAQRVDKPQSGRFPRPDGTMDYKSSVIRESPRNIREDSRGLAPVTGEQGNRGTGEVERTSFSLAHPPVSDIEPKRQAKRSASGAYSDEFEQWWTLYPRKVDKHPASKAFVTARKATSLDTLTDAARRYADEVTGKDAEHVKHAKTWLNQKCWQNYATAAPAPTPTTESAADWLRGEWTGGRVREIEQRTGLTYQRPDLPDDVTGREASERWLSERARQWITDNREEIIARLTTRTAS